MTAFARSLSVVSLLVLTSTRLFAADVAVQLTGTPHAPIGATEYLHVGLTTAQGQNAGTIGAFAPLSASGMNAASVTSGPWTASIRNSLVMLPTSRHRAARH